MSSITIDSVEQPPVAANLGVLEVDAFCAGCHYNLHGQVVTLDERLGIVVCRCPECGKFYPAAGGVSASSVWLRRLSTLLLFLWIVAVLGVILAGMLTMLGMMFSSIGAFSEFHQVGPHGKPVYYKVVNGQSAMVEEGSDIPVLNAKSVCTLRPLHERNNEDELNGLAYVLCSICTIVGFLGGALCVSVMWHWPRGRYMWCLLLPIPPAAFVILCYLGSSQFVPIRGEVMMRIGLLAGLACAGVLVGLLFGRTLARAVVRMIIPPKTRQSLAFLWRVDGKILPPACAVLNV